MQHGIIPRQLQRVQRRRDHAPRFSAGAVRRGDVTERVAERAADEIGLRALERGA